MRIATVAPAFILLAACSKSPSTPPKTDNESNARPEMTAAVCEEQGGKVVGDIGDGAIHEPDYRCPDSGEAPIGNVVAEPGEPIAIEGAVCCK